MSLHSKKEDKIMKHVVIMESNEQFANELSSALAAQNLEVCGVTDDGEEGLALVARNSPAVVVMSLFLKTIDGFSVLDGLRASQKKTDIIVLGNFADDKIINRIIALGARYYLMKPVSATLVADRVCEIAEGVSAPVVNREPLERRRSGSLDERISNIFISIGIPPHIKGYGYLREGIKMAVEDPLVINNVTKGLYPVIAQRFLTSSSKVERAIRHAIEVAWNRGRIDAINAIFGARVYIGTEKPTNSEFIALVADKLILESMV